MLSLGDGPGMAMARQRDLGPLGMILVYITAASPDEARRLGRVLVEERLAACVNLIDGMTALYRWQGAIEEGRETILLAKTRADLFEPLAARIRSLHSYTTPCIVEIPMGRIDAPYLAWLTAETAPPHHEPGQEP